MHPILHVYMQLLVLILRSGINLFRNPITSLVQVKGFVCQNILVNNIVNFVMAACMQIVIMIVFALIVGIVYLRLDQKEVNLQTVVSDRYIAMYIIYGIKKRIIILSHALLIV